jgi:hypothetical protein
MSAAKTTRRKTASKPTTKSEPMVHNPTEKTDEPRAEEDIQVRLKRRAWGLYGQLVMRQIAPMPNFDLFQPDEYEEAASEVHTTIMNLMLSLEAIDVLWACIP